MALRPFSLLFSRVREVLIVEEQSGRWLVRLDEKELLVRGECLDVFLEPPWPTAPEPGVRLLKLDVMPKALHWRWQKPALARMMKGSTRRLDLKQRSRLCVLSAFEKQVSTVGSGFGWGFARKEGPTPFD